MNLTDGHHTPTLIAYCVALVNRVFEGAAIRGTVFLLKMLKLFGLSLTLLNGGPNLEQKAALSDIPESVPALEARFNLDIKSIPYAVCPKCSFTHPPSYSANTADPVYPKTCSERVTRLAEPCGAVLTDNGRTIKTFEYYPFLDWFGRFITLPDIEEYGDRFCDDISKREVPPSNKSEASHGSFLYQFKGVDGRLFVSDRGEEGRWLFMLHGDFFNVEGNRIRGKASSTGVMGLTCLNLPLEMRNDPAYIYIPGIIQGPCEPNAREAEHRHYLRPLTTDLEAGYTRGLQPYSRSSQPCQFDSPSISTRIFRVAIAGVLMDFKAARPYAGLLDVTSHIFCFLCQCWHKAHMGRTDCEAWNTVDDTFLQKGAEMWRDAADVNERKAAEAFYGTRYSELWRLPYWQPSKQLLVDPMHTIYLVIAQRFFRDGLGLENPYANAKKGPRKRAYLAYHYEFTPPPPLSSIPSNRTIVSSPSDSVSEAEDQWLSIIELENISAAQRDIRQARMSTLKRDITVDFRAYRAVNKVHEELSSTAPGTPQEMEAMRKRLMPKKWLALLYVCNDLMVLPEDLQLQDLICQQDITKDCMVRNLIQWVSCVQPSRTYSHLPE